MKQISWKKGIQSGLKTVWELGKIIFPITLVIGILQHTPIIESLIDLVSPIMSLVGLPGEAAIPLVMGNLLNLYAAIGATLPLQFTVKEVFIIALMLTFSHGLPIESAVCRRAGMSFLLITSLRLVLSFLAGMGVHYLWDGGYETARYGLASATETSPSGWGEIIWSSIVTAGVSVLQLALIVIPLMIGIQILRDLKFLEWFAERMKPAMIRLGIAPRGAITMAGGLLFGLAFGAGIILQQAAEQKFTRREITLIMLFLGPCHAIIEDTLIFVPLGINVLPLLLIRFIVAVVLTVTVAKLWPLQTRQTLSTKNA